jgi:hypothetical protein
MGRGGSRPGSGRKKAERPTDGGVARRVFAKVKAEEKWLKALESDDLRIMLDALKYLTDRDEGKAREAIDLTAHVRIDDTRRQHIRDLIARMAGKSQQ